MHTLTSCISLRFTLTGMAGREVGDQDHTTEKMISNVVSRVKKFQRKRKTGPQGRTPHTVGDLK